MPTYNLDLDGPDGKQWVEGYESDGEMKPGSTFTFGDYTWQVMAAAVPQYGGGDVLVLQCIPA